MLLCVAQLRAAQVVPQLSAEAVSDQPAMCIAATAVLCRLLQRRLSVLDLFVLLCSRAGVTAGCLVLD
jgi:hypothetical protein